MAQYSAGTINFAHLGSRAVASADADWSGLPDPTTNTVIISIIGSVLWYQVGAIKAPGSGGNVTPGTVNGVVISDARWELVIAGTGAFGEATNAAARYTLADNFESAFGFPLLNAGDLQTDVLFNRFVLDLVAILQGGNLGGGPGVASLGSNAQVNAGSGKLAIRDPEEGNFHDLDIYGSATGNPTIVINPTGEVQNP